MYNLVQENGSIHNEVCARKGGEIVGAIDVNPAVIGKDVSEIIGTWDKLDVKVTSLEMQKK